MSDENSKYWFLQGSYRFKSFNDKPTIFVYAYPKAEHKIVLGSDAGETVNGNVEAASDGSSRSIGRIYFVPPEAAVKVAPRIEIAPGFALHRWLSSCCPRSFKVNVLDELLATGTFMYQEALAEGDLVAARRIKWAMRFWLLRAVFGGFVTGAFSLLGRLRRKSE